MALSDIAPVIGGLGITQSQVDNYFINAPKAPTPQAEPVITKAKIVALANICFGEGGVQSVGGIKGAASEVELSTTQVKTLIRELKALEQEWNANQ